MDKSIGNILREKRIKAGLSVKDISTRLTDKGYKASEKTIYSWEGGNSQPTPEALLEMCDAYGIQDILSTFGYNGYKKDGSICLNIKEQAMIEKYRSLSKKAQETVSYILDREVTLAKRIAELEARPDNIIEFTTRPDDANRLIEYFNSASAGTGIFIMGNEATEQLPIPDTEENKKVDYAIKVSGYSMEPDFYDGDIVLVSHSEELNYGDVGIFIINNNAYIKEYGEKELISRNPKADNIKIDEYDNIVCMGKVIGRL